MRQNLSSKSKDARGFGLRIQFEWLLMSFADSIFYLLTFIMKVKNIAIIIKIIYIKKTEYTNTKKMLQSRWTIISLMCFATITVLLRTTVHLNSLERDRTLGLNDGAALDAEKYNESIQHFRMRGSECAADSIFADHQKEN